MHLTLKDMEPKSKYILVAALNKHVPCFLLKSVTCLELCSHSSKAVFISSHRQLGNRFPILLKLGKISYQDLFKCVYKCSKHFSISFFRWSAKCFQLVSFILERRVCSENIKSGSSPAFLAFKA